MQKTIVKREITGKASYVEIPPNAYRTMSALREMGYKSTDALLDIVDNSLDAGATRIDLMIKDVSGGKGTDFVIDIQDNGSGMDQAKLQEALRLGSQREYNPEDLGRFGVGLVTAGLSIGRSIRVLSRQEGLPAYDAVMDLDTIATHNKFLIELRPAMAKDAMSRLPDHGTIISLSKVDRINDRNLSRFQERLRESVGRVYRTYIAKGVKFYVGNRLVKGVDPLMLDHELTEVKLDADVNFAPGKSAHLKVVELPDLGAGDLEAGITARNSGFYLVRNGREIAAAETFGLRGLETRHHSYSHFRAELSFTRELDEFFHVNVKKNFIQLDDRMIAKLEALTERFIADSGRRSRDHAAAAPPALPKQSHDLAVKLLAPSANNALQFTEEDMGEEKPMFEKRKNQVVFNRQHPILKFIADEARQRPALLFDVMAVAMAEVAEKLPQGKKFMEALEVQLRETLKRK